MRAYRRVCFCAAILAAVWNAGGCPPGLGFLADFVTVEVVNDTAFPIEGELRYDDESGFFSSLFGGQTLPTGVLEPGEVFQIEFNCDELAVVGTNDVRQLLGADQAQADDSGGVERDEDFDCGDLVRFRFVGEGSSFGVIVSVNGRVISPD